MNFNKRKIIVSDTSDEDDSFKHRRSSLRVNLSYSSNLSDSGNGSLGRTRVENDGRGTDMPQTNRRLSRSKRQFNSNTEDLQTTSNMSKDVVNNDSKSLSSLQLKEGIQLKRLTVNLEDISAKEQTLNTNCKRLKDAILSKTKEIFDKQDELSIRTAMVLGNEEKHPVSTICNLNADNKLVFISDTINQCFENERSTVCRQYTDSVNDRQKKDQYSNIVATPTIGDKRKSIEKVIDRSKLTPKRLFTEKDKLGCRIIGDIILTKKFPMLSLRQPDQSDSPILSGSNKRLQLLRKRSKLLSQSQFGSHNNTHSTVCSDRSINIGQPIVCSTFIENNAIEEKKNNSCDEADNDINISRATRTTNKTISMEMTKIHGGVQLSEKHMSLQSEKSDICNSVKNGRGDESKDENLEQNKSIMSMQRLENVDIPINKLNLQNNNACSNISCTNIANNQDTASVYIDTIIPKMQAASTEVIMPTTGIHDILQAQECSNEINKQNEKQCTSVFPDSNNSIRSSLHVNTSLNVVTETGKMKNIQKSNNDRTIVTSGDFEATNNNEESVAFNENETANTIRTSLEMNTSSGSVRKIWRRKNNSLNISSLIENMKDENLTGDNSSIDNRYSSATEDKETNNIDFLENISLIERLRNISMRNPASYKNKSEVLETRNKDRTGNGSESNNIISAKCQNDERATNNSGDSYVDGTPYPISRSVLFKSQVRHRTQNLNNSSASCSNNINSTNSEKDNNKAMSDTSHSALASDKTHMSNGTSKVIEDDTVILEDMPSCNPFLTQEKLIVIEDTLDETGLETNGKNAVASQDTKCIPVRGGRRKLLPLNENSQLCSIVPLEEHSSTPEKSTPVKRKKKLNKKRPKRKSASYKNDTNSIKHNIGNGQFCSDDDCDTSENKKRKVKRTRKPRKVISKKIVIKKFVNEKVLSILEGSKQNKGNQSMENRNSSDDFVAYRTIPTQWNKYKKQKIVIVTSGLSKGDKSLVKSIVRSLGMAEMELNVSRRTTHVVNTGVRTLNLLRGIIRGCWLITLEWVLKSLENNMWLNPEEFEMKHFSKAVLENRKDRQLFGPSYIPELFTACGLIYVEHKTALPCDTLKELIKTAGGHITENPKLAKITIGMNGLKETWVIDSITTGELQSITFYQRK